MPANINANSSYRLVTSSIFSATIFYATTQLPPAKSAKVMLTVGITLGLFFARKFLMSFKVMPAGIMTVLRYANSWGDVDLSAFAIYKYSKDLGMF